MKVARFSVLEFKSKIDLQKFILAYKKADFIRSAESTCVTQTGEVSLLIFSVYADKQTALKNVSDRKKFTDNISHLLKDEFFYEGMVQYYATGNGKDLSNCHGKSEDTASNFSGTNLHGDIRELKKIMEEILISLRS